MVDPQDSSKKKPDGKQIQALGAEVGADLSRALVAAINKTLGSPETSLTSLNRALVRGMGVIDVSQALDTSKVASTISKALNANIKSIKLDTIDVSSILDTSQVKSVAAKSIQSSIAESELGTINVASMLDFTEVGSALGQALQTGVKNVVVRPLIDHAQLKGTLPTQSGTAPTTQSFHNHSQLGVEEITVDQLIATQRNLLKTQADIKSTWAQVDQRVITYGSLLKQSSKEQQKIVDSLGTIHNISTQISRGLEGDVMQSRLVTKTKADQLETYTAAAKLQQHEWAAAEDLSDLYERQALAQVERKTGLVGVFAAQAMELSVLKQKGALSQVDYERSLDQIKVQQQLQIEGERGIEQLRNRIDREKELLSGVQHYNNQAKLQHALGMHQHAVGEQLLAQGIKHSGVQKDILGMLDVERQGTQDLLLKRVMIGTGLKDQYSQLLTTFMLENQITSLQDPKVKQFARELVHRQHANDHLKHQIDLEESLAKWQLELTEELEEYGHGWEKLKSKVLAVVSDPKILKSFLTVKGLDVLKEGLEETGDIFKEFRHEGLTMAQSFAETKVVLGSIFSLSGASMEEAAHIQGALVKEMGSMDNVTRSTVVEVGKMAKTYGLSAQMAGQLQGQIASLPGHTAESATNSLEFTGALAKAAHVAPGAVMEVIAHNAEATATYTKDGSKNIGIAAVAAAKLGLEFGSITKMADGLLNFENSINRQLEASVLLGREINLDKARELALNGDLVGATKEMLHNIGGEAEFNQMNVLQRRALAEAMGVSVQELSKMVKNQDKLNTLTDEQQKALAEGSMTWDEVLGNASGVGSRLWDGVVAAGTLAINARAIVGGLREGVSTAKDMWDGFKQGAGMLGGLKGAVGGLFGNIPEKGLGEATELVTPAESLTPELDVSQETAQLKTAADQAPKAKSGQGVRDFLTNLAEGLKSMAGGKVALGALNMIPASIGLVTMIPGVLAAKAMELVRGERFRQSLQGLAGGLKSMAGGKVALGALVLIPTSLGFAAMREGAIGLAAVALLGAPAGLGLSGIAAGLTALGAGSALKGALTLGLVGISMIPAAYAFSLLEQVDIGKMVAFSVALPLIGLAAAGLGTMLPFILAGSVAMAAVGGSMVVLAAAMMIFEQAQGGLTTLQSLLQSVSGNAAAIPMIGLLGASLAVLGASALIAVPGIALLGLALLPLVGSVMMLGDSSALVQSNLTAVVTQLQTMVELVPGLFGVGGGLLSIATGLGAIAAAGLFALPSLVALSALSPVASVESGQASGGVAATREDQTNTSSKVLEDKLDLLIEGIKDLVQVASKGGVVNLDGRKVGEVIRLGLNSSGIR